MEVVHLPSFELPALFVDLIEPEPPAFIDHWELGVSEIGVTTDLH